jgi:hypothetical protein
VGHRVFLELSFQGCVMLLRMAKERLRATDGDDTACTEIK